ncbi:tumor necrosis factor receptor superfamily member 6B isoform X2 [Pipistrellus kuhlii]|uniref:TNF receptor superfamily member 6b n=1 Tax=Pipistrellus kuhlii TaxID=59472 RepID=A0A7J7R9W1_PIPKU|nr:tumor necrosis factor receptor superfamily member 6B isoform X2 [Pipistrellus kuhlii]KAF6272980.1 TNF receptor superfamily member 6b [Pipistrellus kuhlii]
MKAPARLPLVLPRALRLLLMLAVLGAAEDVPTYPWRDVDTREWLMCGQCPPGTFVHQPCSRDHPTTCRRCPPHHYTQFWNYLERCLYCNVVCGEHEEEARPCSVLHNRACRCRPGFFEFAGFCLEHTPCPPGCGVVALGTPTQDTQCQPCPPGTFSANSSSSERCQPHSNCTALGLGLNVPGTPFRDAMCTSCTGPPLGTPEPGSTGTEECERALVDFVAFQNVSFRRLLQLQQALSGPGAWAPRRPPEDRLSLQQTLRRQLTKLREARPGALAAGLLQALRTARLPGMARTVRQRFSLAG